MGQFDTPRRIALDEWRPGGKEWLTADVMERFGKPATYTPKGGAVINTRVIRDFDVENMAIDSAFAPVVRRQIGTATDKRVDLHLPFIDDVHGRWQGVGAPQHDGVVVSEGRTWIVDELVANDEQICTVTAIERL